MDWSTATPPDAAVIEAMAQKALATVPEAFRTLASDVVIRVEELADADMLADLEIENPFELTGLYDGVPLTMKSVSDQPDRPDMIWLFRRAILDEWIDREDIALYDLVAHVLVHELAHHFGWSDDDIAAIDEWWT